MEIRLDPFQEAAIEWIEKDHSVLVSAPTGSGKTLIAEAAIGKAISRNQQVIYTSPIKALSNQKYRDFKNRYGESAVGILTGDVSINPDAPILIMTTEIYRNSLFENLDRIKKVGWVIFDEIHYLDDPERGTVWEEAILFTPFELKILALSATVPNVRELAAWLRTIHNRPIAVVEESQRPVPLHFLFQCQGEMMESLKQLRAEGYLQRDNWKLSHRQMRRFAKPLRAKPNRLDHLIHHLIQRRQLPVIYFVFGRRRAEFLASEALKFDLLTPEEKKQIRYLYDQLLSRYDLKSERSADDLRILIEQGIAYHHAGMLPTLKEVIEQLFTSRLIKIIFTTETFALGINMPARCVVFDGLEKYYGSGFRHLTTRDFYQMAGRAGRRGMDAKGYAYLRIHPQDISFQELERLLHGKPEPIQSQLNTSYATLLNLYKNLGPKLLEIYPQTFHHFQVGEKNRKKGLQTIQNKIDFLKSMGYLTATELTPKGALAASLFGYELLLSEMFEHRALDGLNHFDLNMLLSGLVFEPRKGDTYPKLNSRMEKIRKSVEQFAHLIHREEQRFRIHPYTRGAYFHLAPAMEAWTRGESFENLMRMTSVDEGELVRHFRMVIQILRSLANAPHLSEDLQALSMKCRQLINRGVVDAEQQLRS